jgi:hypothetical protein
MMMMMMMMMMMRMMRMMGIPFCWILDGMYDRFSGIESS